MATGALAVAYAGATAVLRQPTVDANIGGGIAVLGVQALALGTGLVLVVRTRHHRTAAPRHTPPAADHRGRTTLAHRCSLAATILTGVCFALPSSTVISGVPVVLGIAVALLLAAAALDL